MFYGEYADVPSPSEQIRRYAEVRARLTRKPEPAKVVDVPKFLPVPTPQHGPVPVDLFCALSQPHVPYDPESGVAPGPRRLTMRIIIAAVAEEFGVLASEIQGPRRNRRFVVPRQVAMWIGRECTSCSYPLIGASMGDRDHSTVIHGAHKIEQEVANGTLLGIRAQLVRLRLEDEYGVGSAKP